MAINRERKPTSPDLDIFGDDEEAGTNEEREADSNSMDIFGESAEEAKAEGEDEEASKKEDAEEGSEEVAAEGEPDWASIFGDEPETEEKAEGTEGNETDGESQIDPEIENLLKEVEDTQDKDDRDDIITELRKKLVDQQVEIDSLSRHKQVLNDKLMASSASDTELGIYKETISKLESNPRLRALVRYASSSDEGQKNKFVTILGDLLEEATGQDVSSLLDKSRGDKAKAALGGKSSAAPAGKSSDEEEPMDYEESITSLF